MNHSRDPTGLFSKAVANEYINVVFSKISGSDFSEKLGSIGLKDLQCKIICIDVISLPHMHFTFLTNLVLNEFSFNRDTKLEIVLL